MKSKPAKYGIKVWAVEDRSTSYVVKMQVYLGKLFEHKIILTYLFGFYSGKLSNKVEKDQGQRVVL